jgi:hypothetical protein
MLGRGTRVESASCSTNYAKDWQEYYTGDIVSYDPARYVGIVEDSSGRKIRFFCSNLSILDWPRKAGLVGMPVFVGHTHFSKEGDLWSMSVVQRR